MFRETFTTEEGTAIFLHSLTFTFLNPAMWGIKNKEEGYDKVIYKRIQNKNIAFLLDVSFQYTVAFSLYFTITNNNYSGQSLTKTINLIKTLGFNFRFW